MGSIIKDKNGSTWAIRYDGPKIKGERNQLQEGGFGTKAIAAKELKKREAAALEKKPANRKDILLADFILIWLDRLRKKQRAPKTIEFYRSIAENHIIPHFKKTKLSELYGDDIEDYYFYLNEETALSPASIHHNHKTLRACLNSAVRWGYIPYSPMVNVEAPSQKKAKIKYWEPKQIKAGLKIFEGTALCWYVNFTVLTGLRLGEVCAIHESQIDLKNNTFYVCETSQRKKGTGIIYKETKTDESTDTMPLTAAAKKILKARLLEIKYERVQNADIYDKSRSGYLAVWPDGHVMDPTYVSGQFSKILKAYNESASDSDKLPQITFHGLRHSCATWLLYNEVDMKTIQAILRHSNYKFTADTYSHVLLTKEREALEKLSL